MVGPGFFIFGIVREIKIKFMDTNDKLSRFIRLEHKLFFGNNLLKNNNNVSRVFCSTLPNFTFFKSGRKTAD